MVSSSVSEMLCSTLFYSLNIAHSSDAITCPSSFSPDEVLHPFIGKYSDLFSILFFFFVAENTQIQSVLRCVFHFVSVCQITFKQLKCIQPLANREERFIAIQYKSLSDHIYATIWSSVWIETPIEINYNDQAAIICFKSVLNLNWLEERKEKQ